MTVVVAVSDGKRVCMACDSQATNNGAKSTLSRSSAKIVRVGGTLFGCGHLTLIDAIRYGLPIDKSYGESSTIPFRWWATNVLVPWLREYLKDRELMDKGAGGAAEFPSGMLVAHKGEFLLVDKNIGTIGFSEPFSAIGSGWCEARGAMWAHNLVVGKLADADAIACMGVEAAIALDSGCGPPVCLEWTEA